MSKQSMEALALANEVRLKRAAWRRRTKALGPHDGKIKIARLLERGSYPTYLASIKLRWLLMSADRIGTTLADHICEDAYITRSVNTELRALTSRERHSLARVLRERARFATK